MLLRAAWAPLGVVLIAAGLMADYGPLIGLGIFLLLAGALAQLWAERALDRVTLERLLPESRAFPGQRVRLDYRLTNAKPIPLPRVRMRDLVPRALWPDDLPLRPSGSPDAVAYTRTTRLGWNERAAWSLELPCTERGYYRIGPARLSSGDGFGLFTIDRDEPAVASVVVYPPTFALPDLGLPSARPLGERKGRERIFEDPLRIAGVRDYEPGDMLRRIDWKATARSGQLQSRLYEPSNTQHLLVVLNVDTMEHSWQGYLPEQLEANISVAASIARWAFEARYATGLLANGSLPDSARPIRIAPGRAPDQLLRILEALGGIGPMTMTSLAELLEQESHRLPLGATLAVVTSALPDALAAALRRLHDAGQRVALLATGEDDWAAQLAGMSVQRVAPPAMTEAAR